MYGLLKRVILTLLTNHVPLVKDHKTQSVSLLHTSKELNFCFTSLTLIEWREIAFDFNRTETVIPFKKHKATIKEGATTLIAAVECK